MRVLVLCEQSGTVRDAFMKRGHDALSVDILPDESGSDLAWAHCQMDALHALNTTGKWDLIIAHPPCTALCVAGNSSYGEGMIGYPERLAAVEWTVTARRRNDNTKTKT
jgi:hypothetical protein